MYERTSLIINKGNPKQNGVEPFIYRYRGCDNNLNSNTPANQYQRLKLIQNTVRVESSLYTMNLGALNTYEAPDANYQVVDIAGANYLVSPGVNWNQMSDRRQPHRQFATASGSTYGGNSTKRTIVRLRPGALSPGGHGVDIKHNSYDRYLNRLKGKGPIRRGVIPPDFGAPIPFNRAFPIYGGKTVKTSIVSGCNCPIVSNNNSIYESPAYDYEFNNVVYKFSEGQYVCTKEVSTGLYVKAIIITINSDGTYVVKFEDGTTETKTENELNINFTCNYNCNSNSDSNNSTTNDIMLQTCYDPAYIAIKNSC